MSHLSYEESKKVVFRGLILLAIVTLFEVFIALLGKGYIIDGFTLTKWIMYGAMICLSLYKAYFIIYEFMHLKYEVPGMRKSVLLPLILLVWGIIAFMQEGSEWGKSRAAHANPYEIEDPDFKSSSHQHDSDTKIIDNKEDHGNHQDNH